MSAKSYCNACHQEADMYWRLFCDYCGKELPRSRRVKVNCTPEDREGPEDRRERYVDLAIENDQRGPAYCCVECMIKLLEEARKAHHTSEMFKRAREAQEGE